MKRQIQFKEKLYNLLENDSNYSTPRAIFDIILAIVILTSIILFFIESKNGELSPLLLEVDLVITVFFIIEFLLRGYVCSNFREDWKKNGAAYAIYQKVDWLKRPMTVVDFLAILPGIKAFRVFKSFRILRLFRLLRAKRLYVLLKEQRIIAAIKGMKESARVFYITLIFTALSFIFVSSILFFIENGEGSEEFDTYPSALWYAVKVLGFGNDTPRTLLGHILTAFLLLLNMAIFGTFISLIITKIQGLMNAITSGKIGKIKHKNHIVICGYTKSSKLVIEGLLKNIENRNKIVLISEKTIEDTLDGVIYINGDYTDDEILAKANISEASYAVIFAEFHPHDTIRDVDLRTVLTVFNIEKINKNIHTIAEIQEEKNAEIIRDKIQGDEILYKEVIDSKIILNCLDTRYISEIFYNLLGGVSHKDKNTTKDVSSKIHEIKLEDCEINLPCTAKDLKFYFIENEASLIGYIDKDNTPHVSPKNDEIIPENSRIIYIK